MTDELARDALVRTLQRGLPLVTRPFAALAQRAQWLREGQLREDAESTLISATRKLLEDGAVSRFGIVVRHRAFGYTHNAMVVWDVADTLVDEVGESMSRFDFVTLCYRRPRRPPQWHYNLFCMVHGRARGIVQRQVRALTTIKGLEQAPHAVLFSTRCFKQRGARYQPKMGAGQWVPSAATQHLAGE